MFRLKTLTILGSKAELASLPEGKLLINTINAHSYNTARKDGLFAEALTNGDVLIPDGVSIVKACVDNALQLGLPEAQLPLAQACILLATAPKSNSVVAAIDAARADVRAGKSGNIPRAMQNVHADGTGFEREQGYKYPHNYPGHWVRQQYLPDSLKNAHYYEYGDNKTEQAAKAYWELIKK